MEAKVLDEFKKHSIYRLEEGLRMITKALSFVDAEQFWEVPFDKGMSLGNQLMHLKGNLHQYLISSLGNQPDERVRDEEFLSHPQVKKEVLLAQLQKTVADSITCIQKASSSDYLKIRKVQAFSFSGLGAVLHAVEHFSYHVGQTAFWVKYVTRQELNFYEGIDLTEKNENHVD